MAFDDILRIPFRFIPDGSPEASIPPPPGYIRIRARFIPYPAGGDQPETAVSRDTDGADSGTAPSASNGWDLPHVDGTAISPRVLDAPQDTFAAFGRSLLPSVAPVPGGALDRGTEWRDLSAGSPAESEPARGTLAWFAYVMLRPPGAYDHWDEAEEQLPLPSEDARSDTSEHRLAESAADRFTAVVALDTVGARFADPGAPSDSVDPRVAVVDAEVGKVVQYLQHEIDEEHLIVPENRAVAGTILHTLFAQKMRELNLPGVAIEQSFVLGEEERYGADGSIRTDIICETKMGIPLPSGT